VEFEQRFPKDLFLGCNKQILMSFAFRKLKQHQSRFRYWISSWLDIHIIIGFRLQKRIQWNAILSKVKPNKVVYGTGIEHMDFEGRVI
jgi:hypothetical protein